MAYLEKLWIGVSVKFSAKSDMDSARFLRKLCSITFSVVITIHAKIIANIEPKPIPIVLP